MSLATFAEIDAKIRGAIERWTPGAVVERVDALTPDASLRRYFRARLQSPIRGSIQSIVAMWFDSVACPEAAGGKKIDSDEAYVELSKFFLAEKIAVPELYLDARPEKLVLLEDLGDVQLATLLLSEPRASTERLRPLFFAAIDQLLRIQGIGARPDFFPFQRSFTAPLYEKEMTELEEFLLAPKNPPAETKDVVRKFIEELAVELESLPRVLAHRDFHAWNLIIDASGRLRVIDFQDALLATRPYDVVSLLNDRDMDALLGRELYCECVEYFVSSGKLGRSVLSEYDRALLQRDLKVAGRFAKLNTVRGLKHYTTWIPGTLRRIGRTLERLGHESSSTAKYHRMLRSLEAVFPEVAAGAADPLRWEA